MFLHHCFSDFGSFKALSEKRDTGYLSGAISAFLGIFLLVWVNFLLKNVINLLAAIKPS